MTESSERGLILYTGAGLKCPNLHGQNQLCPQFPVPSKHWGIVGGGPTQLNGLDIVESVQLSYLRQHPTLTIIYLVVLVTTGLMGMIGNVLIIVAVCIYRKLKTQANIFTVNLAIADCLVSYLAQGFHIVGVVLGYQFFQDKIWLCNIVGHICIITCACSLWNMAAIAVYRAVMLCHRSFFQRFLTWRVTVGIAILLWIPTGMIDLPNYLGWGEHHFDPKIMACRYSRTANYYFLVFFVSVTIFPPVVTVLISYVHIFVYVLNSRKVVEEHGSMSTGAGAGKAKGYSDREIRLAKNLMIIFSVFMVCWTPYGLLILIDQGDRAHKAAYMFTAVLAHTNSSINVVLYGILNRDFRHAYLIVLRFISCGMSSGPDFHAYNASTYSISNAHVPSGDHVSQEYPGPKQDHPASLQGIQQELDVNLQVPDSHI